MSEKRNINKRNIYNKDVSIEKISWDSAGKMGYQAIIETLAYDIQKGMEEEKITFDYICGIPRGGLVPATSLSHLLEIPMMDYYDGRIDVNNILFVDDVVHAGRTATKLPSNHNVLKYRLVSLVKNEDISQYSEGLVWKSGIEVGKYVWVNFPWEMSISIQQAVKNLRRHIIERDFNND